MDLSRVHASGRATVTSLSSRVQLCDAGLAQRLIRHEVQLSLSWPMAIHPTKLVNELTEVVTRWGKSQYYANCKFPKVALSW